MADHSRVDVLVLAEKAVKMPSKYGHGDVGDALVSMLKGEISANRAHERISDLMLFYAEKPA